MAVGCAVAAKSRNILAHWGAQGVGHMTHLFDQCGVQSLAAAFLCEAAHEPSDSVLYVRNHQICAPHKRVVVLCSTIV